MEYCEGGDLHSFLSKVPVSNDKANYFFTQIMRGVAYMHELGVAHRDLKLENVNHRLPYSFLKCQDITR